jgi:hypothetical protein
MPGVARRLVTFFASPKKVTQKRRPQAAALRVPVCAKQKMGSERNSPAAQTAFTSLSIFCFAQTAASQRGKSNGNFKIYFERNSFVKRNLTCS